LLLTPAVRDFALRRKIIDTANSSRKVHTGSIPRIGGIAILCAFFFSLSMALFVDPSLLAGFGEHRMRIWVFLGGAAVIGGLGLIDDFRSLPARWKLAVQCAVAVTVYAAGIRITEVAFPGMAPVQLHAFALPVTVFWIVGVVNALNLIDGLDGLAGGVALLALATNCALSAAAGRDFTAIVLVAAAASVLGFLRYNFNPATVFMGDAGSMFLGYLLAVSSMVESGKTSMASTVGVALAILAVPLADTALAIARRILRGRAVSSADREHIHHQLLAAGLSHRNTVLVLYGVSATFCSLALFAAFVGGRLVPAMALTGCAAAAVAFWRLRLLPFHEARSLSAQRRKNRAIRAVVHDVKSRVRVAATLPEVLETLVRLTEVLSASRAVARVESPKLLRRDFEGGGAAHGQAFRVCFPIGALTLGSLEVLWTDGRREIHRDDEIAVENICVCLEKAVRRISPRTVPERRSTRRLGRRRVIGFGAEASLARSV
jgi:UDP-GlcNAc:undecaprenyl-phosphate GlcNAc-1-phosphate transferase